MTAVEGASSYDGEVDESKVEELIRSFGELVEGSREVGFVLTYHAVNAAGEFGRMNLAGTGISHAQLGTLLAEALEHDAEHGSTR